MIVDPYQPNTAAGREAVRFAADGLLTRDHLSRLIRAIRTTEGPFAARWCLAWLDDADRYPHKRASHGYAWACHPLADPVDALRTPYSWPKGAAQSTCGL